MNSVRLLIFALLLTLTSCNKEEDNVDKVSIRLRNTSAYNYTDIKINTGSGETIYGNVNTGQFSAYKTVEFAYRYAYVELKIKGEKYTLQPIDYVGETKLQPGKYTYMISNDPSSTRRNLNLSLQKD